MTSLAESRSLASSVISDRPASRLFWGFALALLGTALLTISAKTKVPMWPVDISLQTMVVLLIGATYGSRLAVGTLLLYLAEGATGLPVFQGTPERGLGLAYMVGPTGGYLIGFVAAAGLVGWAADRGWSRDPFKLFAVMLVASVLILALGAAWLAYLFGAEKAFALGVAPFVFGDLVKAGLAAALVPAVWSLIGRFRR
ncbi:biotin transporter BioY [Afifella pfennigii]|uniref:biotin transporter BioY n=1 Tax=Afifella pfennigii TaxID=209897 RepID=UPI00047A837A